MSFAGPLYSAYSQYTAGESQSKIYERNAQLSEENANQALLLSAQEERRQRIVGAKALGSIKAGFGASGVTMDGSAFDVLAASAAQAELDAMNIRYAGESKRRSYLNEAAAGRFSGSMARTAGRLGAAASVIDSGTKAASLII